MYCTLHFLTKYTFHVLVNSIFTFYTHNCMIFIENIIFSFKEKLKYINKYVYNPMYLICLS